MSAYRIFPPVLWRHPLTEANRFLWPGPDLRPLRSGDAGSVACGLLPYKLMEAILGKFLALVKARHAGLVPRTA